jgi:hypothetical protein|nr:hypothetical protein [uncultured Ralstonia sp.]
MRDKQQKAQSQHDALRHMRQGEAPPGIPRDKLHDPGQQTPAAPPTDNRN